MRKDAAMVWELGQITALGPNWKEELQNQPAPGEEGGMMPPGGGAPMGGGAPPAFGPPPPGGEEGAPPGEPDAGAETAPVNMGSGSALPG